MYMEKTSYHCTRIWHMPMQIQVFHAVCGEFSRLLDVEGSTFCLHGVTNGIK